MRRLLLALALVVVAELPAAAQQCGVYKTWIAGEVLTTADLNASFVRTVDANTPTCVDDYSNTIGQMQTVTNPFPGGVESLPTKLSGELERIRYQLKAIIGGAQWYSVPANNLAGTSFLQLTEIGDPAAGAANTARIYAKDNGSGTTILAYKDAAGTVRPILTSDITSTVASLTFPLNPTVATPPPGQAVLYAVSGTTNYPAFIVFKDSLGNQHGLSVADQQVWTGYAGLEITRPTASTLNITVDRMSFQAHPLHSINATVNLALTGAGGRACVGAVCDPLLPNSFYYVWVGFNGTAYSHYGFLTSDLAPYVSAPSKWPPGTDKVRLVGAWRTDAASQFYDGVQRDNLFNYGTPRLVPSCCGPAVGNASGTLTLSDVPVTVSRANLLVVHTIPDAEPDNVPDVGGVVAFRAHFRPIVGGLASTAVSFPLSIGAGPTGTVHNSTILLSGPTASPIQFYWETDVLGAQVYVTGWELQMRDP